MIILIMLIYYAVNDQNTHLFYWISIEEQLLVTIIVLHIKNKLDISGKIFKNITFYNQSMEMDNGR